MEWIDIWEWVDVRLADGLPGVTIVAEADIRTPTAPTIIWSATTSHDGQFWSAMLSLVLLCDPSQASDLLGRVTDVVEAWQTPGPIHSVQLDSLTGERAANHAVRQYTLQYTLQWP